MRCPLLVLVGVVAMLAVSCGGDDGASEERAGAGAPMILSTRTPAWRRIAW